MKRLLITGLFVLVVTGAYANADAPPPARHEPGFTAEVKETGREFGHAVRSGAKAVKEGAKDAWHKTSEAASEAGHSIKHGAQGAWDGTREAFASSPKKTEQK